MSKIKRLLDLPKKHSFFLFGPRAIGKSTLIREELPLKNALYFNLLNQDLFIQFSGDPQKLKSIIESRKKNITHIIIDEIQLVPSLLNVVHQIMDLDHSLYFCLSGSSARKLKRGGANMLGGRAWNLNLYPFTHLELGKIFDLNRALDIGTLPQAYLAESLSEARKTLKSYVGIYIEEEIKAEALVRDLRGFIKFLEISASDNGNELNFSNIARETFNKAHDIKEFFQILEDTLLGFFLLPYTKSTRKLARHPKFYFFDTGVQRALANKISLELSPGNSDYGKAFEHWLIKEIVHLNNYFDTDYKFSFYRTHHGAEVDLIVETPRDQVYAIEIKSSTRISSRDLNGLKSFAEICPQAKLLCATTHEHCYQQDSILVYPWSEIIKLLYPKT